MKKIFIVSALSIFILAFYVNLMSFSTGIGGRTRKNINEPEIGCSCHKILPVPSVVVTISGPGVVLKGSTNIYKITITGGPHVKAGFDFNVAHGGIDVAEPDSTQNFGIDITHRFPKIFDGRDTVSWLVKYIAPMDTLGFDTLYATGNSVNGNGMPDSLDNWNFSNDFIVNVVSSIGVQPISSAIPETFKLYQNYPNPFNPNTKIKFDIQKNGRTTLRIYNSVGEEVSALINENLSPGTYEINWNSAALSSGVYFAKLTVDNFSDVKKMILIK
jgi:hypothetical protein